MALTQSTATLTVNEYPRGVDNTQRTQIIRGKVALSPGLYPSGGYSVTWGALAQTGSGQGVESIPAGGTATTIFPIDVDIKSVAKNTTAYGSGPTGYIYVWDNVAGNIHIFESLTNAPSGASGPLIEYGGDVSSRIVNDVITFTAVFQRG